MWTRSIVLAAEVHVQVPMVTEAPVRKGVALWGVEADRFTLCWLFAKSSQHVNEVTANNQTWPRGPV